MDFNDSIVEWNMTSTTADPLDTIRTNLDVFFVVVISMIIFRKYIVSVYSKSSILLINSLRWSFTFLFEKSSFSGIMA